MVKLSGLLILHVAVRRSSHEPGIWVPGANVRALRTWNVSATTDEMAAGNERGKALFKLHSEIGMRQVLHSSRAQLLAGCLLPGTTGRSVGANKELIPVQTELFDRFSLVSQHLTA